MKYKIKVDIDGRTYILNSEQNDGYIEKLAGYVDAQINMAGKSMRASSLDNATMAAMNIADLYLREKNAGENLRKQLKEALDENSRQKREIAELNRKYYSQKTI